VPTSSPVRHGTASYRLPGEFSRAKCRRPSVSHWVGMTTWWHLCVCVYVCVCERERSIGTCIKQSPACSVSQSLTRSFTLVMPPLMSAIVSNYVNWISKCQLSMSHIVGEDLRCPLPLLSAVGC